MGFHDFRCAITGVSLKGADAVAVALEPVDDGYRPIILGISGNLSDSTEDNPALALAGTRIFATLTESRDSTRTPKRWPTCSPNPEHSEER